VSDVLVRFAYIQAAERGGAREVERVIRHLLRTLVPPEVPVFLLPHEVQSGFG
jgi:hypothetical protein